MKKFVTMLLTGLLLLGLSVSASASLAEKKAEFVKVKKYLGTLDKKIKKARSARKVNKVSQLKDLKRKALARAKTLKGEISQLESGTAVEPTKRAEPGKKLGWLVGAGYGGGAGIVDVGYVWPIKHQFDLIVSGGLGIGSGYTIIGGKVAGLMPVWGHFVGLEGGLANYSQTIAGVMGVSGNLASGANYGVGVFVGTTLGDFQVQAGYNTALGLTAGGVYKFF